MTTGLADIMALLPMRPPMVLVDRVISLEPGLSVVVDKAVTGGEPCFLGLAEGLPAERYAFPRSLMIESFGQAAALLWLGSRSVQAEAVTDPEAVPMVGRLRRCRFHGNAFPGDVIRHTIRIDTVIGSNAFLSGVTTVAERMTLTVECLVAVERSRTVVAHR